MGILTAYPRLPIQTSASIGWSTSPYEDEVGMALYHQNTTGRG